MIKYKTIQSALVTTMLCVLGVSAPTISMAKGQATALKINIDKTYALSPKATNKQCQRMFKSFVMHITKDHTFPDSLIKVSDDFQISSTTQLEKAIAKSANSRMALSESNTKVKFGGKRYNNVKTYATVLIDDKKPVGLTLANSFCFATGTIDEQK